MGRENLGTQKEDVDISYSPTQTGRRFHHDQSFVRGILGPVGSSKSVTCVMELFIKAMDETPGPTGVRKSRMLVIRSTFPELKTTTIKTFMEWFGNIGTITWDSPIRYQCNLPLPDGTVLDWEVWFKPVDGSQDSLDALRSLEVTGVFMNEAHEFAPEVYDLLAGRVGRFRPFKEQDPKWAGIVLDSNFGSDTCPLRQYMLHTPKNWAFFVQPPAVLWDAAKSEWKVNADAENLNHLRGGVKYYEQQLGAMKEHNIRQLLACQWATPRSSKPVFPEFDSNTHVYKGHMLPDKTLPLVIGMDFGLHVGATLLQLTPTGSCTVLDELWDDDASLEDFISDQLVPLLHKSYRNMVVHICGDPAGQGRSANDKRTPFSILKNAGFAAQPAPTNDPVLRRDAVRAFLNRKDGFSINPSCTRLVEGLSGAVGYKRLPDGSYSEQLVKNVHSHVCFVPETLVDVPFGFMRIGDIRVGDVVMTPKGPYPVLDVMRREADLISLVDTYGNQTICTPDHPFYTEDGVVYAKDIDYDTRILTSRDIVWKNNILAGITMPIMMVVGTIAERLRQAQRITCTGKCTNTTTGRFCRGVKSITGTIIRQTMTYAICIQSKVADIGVYITGQTKDGRMMLSGIAGLWRKLRRGIAGLEGQFWLWRLTPKQLPHGNYTERHCMRMPHVNTAEQFSHVYQMPESSHGTALKSAYQQHEESVGMTTSPFHVQYAEACLLLENTQKCAHAPRRVVMNSHAGRGQVVNITVGVEHKYYANGYLVSNCESMEYGCLMVRSPMYNNVRKKMGKSSGVADKVKRFFHG